MVAASTAPNTLEVLDAWELLGDSPAAAVQRLSVGDFREIGQALDRFYSEALQPNLGGCHVGLSDSIRIAEAQAPLSDLAFALVTHDHLWLPDGVYSFLSLKASGLWQQTPEGGGGLLGARKGITMKWRSLWDFPKEGRLNAARKTLPRLLEVLRNLRPLILKRFVRLFAWERSAYSKLDSIRDAVLSFETNPLTAQVHRAFPQGEYTVGPRVGQISITANHDMHGVKKGEQLHFVDTTPMLLTAVANLEVSAATGSTYQPKRRGDRISVEFIANGGLVIPQHNRGWPLESIPNIGAALWPDVQQIRGDSQTLADLRSVLEAAEDFEGSPDQLVTALRDRFEEVGARLREDVSLVRATKNALTNMSVDTVTASGAAGLAAMLSGAGLQASAGVAVMAAPVKVLLNRLFDATRKSKKQRGKLLLRISDRL